MPKTLTPYTSEAADAIVASVEQGSSFRQAALANGFSQDQITDWLRISRGETAQRNGFAYSDGHKDYVTRLTQRVQRAIASRYTVLTNSLYLNATTKNPKTGWFDTQAADKLLSKSPDTRQEWFEQRATIADVHVELHPAHSVVRELSNQDLLELEQRMLDAPEPK